MVDSSFFFLSLRNLFSSNMSESLTTSLNRIIFSYNVLILMIRLSLQLRKLYSLLLVLMIIHNVPNVNDEEGHDRIVFLSSRPRIKGIEDEGADDPIRLYQICIHQCDYQTEPEHGAILKFMSSRTPLSAPQRCQI